MVQAKDRLKDSGAPCLADVFPTGEDLGNSCALIDARNAGKSPMPSLSTPWIAALAMLTLALFVPGVLNDGDTFLHITAGEWMISHRAVLHADPFSYTFSGSPWVAHEWLSEVVLSLAYRFGGWTGVVVLTALTVGLTFFMLAHHLRRWLPAGVSLLVLLLAGSCIVPSLLARPHILALPLFEVWVAGLFIARSAGRTPSLFLLPIMAIWANAHGGFILGLMLIPPLALEAMLAEPAMWRGVLLRWGGFFLAATMAALVTPHGLTGLLFPFHLMGVPELAMVGEWQPTNFSTLQPLELILAVGLYIALSRGANLPLIRLLMLVGLLHMALQHTRHIQLIGIILPLLIAQPLSAVLLPLKLGDSAQWWRPFGLATMVVLLMLRSVYHVARVDSATAPISGLEHVPTAWLAEPVFNDYAFGGYLMFAHVRPFIDSRVEVYGSAFLRQYAAMTQPNGAALKAVFQTYGIHWTMLSPANPAVALLDTLPNWCRFYTDAIAVIHTQNCPGQTSS